MEILLGGMKNFCADESRAIAVRVVRADARYGSLADKSAHPKNSASGGTLIAIAHVGANL